MEFTSWRRHVLCFTQTLLPPFFDFGQAAPLRGSLVPHHTLQLCCPCFTGFYAGSYSLNLRVTQVEGDLCSYKHFPPPIPLTTLVKLFPPCRGTLLLVEHSILVVPVDSVLCVDSLRELWRFAAEGGCVRFYTNTPPPLFTTLVKLSPSWEGTR